jgi:hypothetical protein
MNIIKSVYIVEPSNQGWIIEKLMQHIIAELTARGISVEVGHPTNYSSQDVIFNSRFLVPTFNDKAKVNSLFVTHVDDRIKELELKVLLSKFNSFVCLSPEDAHFLSNLKGNSRGIVGINLPSLNLDVDPIKIAIFSNRYEDGRKNESWILDYCASCSDEFKRSFIFCFIGDNWASFCEALSKIDINYEIYRYSRAMPNEYEQCKKNLQSMDLLIYPGFDGGAMSIYDGIAAGLDILVSNISYHQHLSDEAILFNNKSEFFNELNKSISKVIARRDLLASRNISSYVEKLLHHWDSIAEGTNSHEDALYDADNKTLNKYRKNYKKITLSRIRSAMIRLIQTYLPFI